MNCLLMLNRRCAQVQSEPSASRGSCWIFAEPEIICVDWCAYTQWIPSNHHVRHFDKSRPREWHPLCIFMSDSLDHFPSTAHTKDHRHGTCQHKYYINRYLQSLVARWIDICPHSRLASFQQARSICYKHHGNTSKPQPVKRRKSAHLLSCMLRMKLCTTRTLSSLYPPGGTCHIWHFATRFGDDCHGIQN